MKFQLKETCGACPQIFDVYHNEEYIGYIRIRHGYLRADFRNYKTIYSANTRGDGLLINDERDEQLTACCNAFEKALLEEQSEEREPEKNWEFI